MKLLKKLVGFVGPSGHEQEVGEFYQNTVNELCDLVGMDVLGNVSAHIKTSMNKKTVMISAHMDEIGYMVKYIDNNGFIYFYKIGGGSELTMPGQRVLVKTTTGEIIKGTIGCKPSHFIKGEDRKKAISIKDMWIDVCGQHDKVSVGDAMVPDVEFVANDKYIMSRALDDRSGVWVLIDVLKSFSYNGTPNYNVICTANTREEIGMRGAIVSSYNNDIDMGIAIDVTHAIDYPGVNKKEFGNIELGKGPAICVGPNFDKKLTDSIIKIAKTENIPYQVKAIPCLAGNEARAMQISRSGVKTAGISIPLRYMHTQSEILHIDDLQNTVLLLIKFLNK